MEVYFMVASLFGELDRLGKFGSAFFAEGLKTFSGGFGREGCGCGGGPT